MPIVHADRFTNLPEPGHVLNGKVTAGSSRTTFRKTDPSTGEVIAEIPEGTAADVDAAVASCHAALPGWRAVSAPARRRILLNIANKLREYTDEFNLLTTLEVGAIPGWPMTELPADYYEYYAGWVDKNIGQLVPSYPHQGLGFVKYEPLGVIGSLLSWNGPIGACGLKVAAALAGGNCVVIKPSELGPLQPIKFIELCLEAGVPEGVLNVVQGGPEVGKAIVDHPGIAKVTYTGGVGAGRQILAAAGRLGKQAVLELGGKSANVVFEDADLEPVIAAQAMTVTALAGQVCLRPSRMLVQRSIYDEVAAEVTKRIAATKVGDPFAEGTAMGPVISETSRERVRAYIEHATSSGTGELLTGGDPLPADLDGGYFVRPAVFGHVDPTSDLGQEECFGPVLSLLPFDDEADAVRLANATDYGLSAFVQTKDVGRAHRVADALQAGYVGINGMFSVRAGAPFGGVKGSGVGWEGGVEGMNEFLVRKHIEVHL